MGKLQRFIDWIMYVVPHRHIKDGFIGDVMTPFVTYSKLALPGDLVAFYVSVCEVLDWNTWSVSVGLGNLFRLGYETYSGQDKSDNALLYVRFAGKLFDYRFTTNWAKAIEDFQDAIFEPDSTHIVEFTWAGEGNWGDYDPDNPNDVPLLRFYVHVWNEDAEGTPIQHTDGSPSVMDTGGTWEEAEDGSYCTALPINTPTHLLDLMADNVAAAYQSSKRRLEEITWITVEELQIAYEAGNVLGTIRKGSFLRGNWLFGRLG